MSQGAESVESAENQQPKAPALSARETELGILAWRAIDTDGGTIKIDFDRLAEVAGFKNSQSARACFNPIKKKLMEGVAAAPTPKKTPKKAARKRQSDDADDKDIETPTKKSRGSSAKKAKAKAAAVAKDETDIDDDNIDTATAEEDQF